MAKRSRYHPLILGGCLFLLASLGYLSVGLHLFLIQNDLIYAAPSPPLSPEEAARQAQAVGLVPWAHTTPGASGPQGYAPANFAAPAPRGTIVFFHGNGDHAWLSADRVAPFTQRGFRVFFYEYPGFGGRPGFPSEKNIVPDAQALVRSLVREGFGPIYVWGESLGTGVAAAVCADKSLPIEGLTLTSPWDNIANVGLSYYPCLPVRPFMKDQYDSIANLRHFQHPICVIRGDQDDTIVPALTLNLFAHLPEPKKMMLMKGYGHGDWPSGAGLSWWDEALNFIAPPLLAGSPAPTGQPNRRLRSSCWTQACLLPFCEERGVMGRIDIRVREHALPDDAQRDDAESQDDGEADHDGKRAA